MPVAWCLPGVDPAPPDSLVLLAGGGRNLDLNPVRRVYGLAAACPDDEDRNAIGEVEQYAFLRCWHACPDEGRRRYVLDGDRSRLAHLRAPATLGHHQAVCAQHGDRLTDDIPAQTRRLFKRLLTRQEHARRPFT